FIIASKINGGVLKGIFIFGGVGNCLIFLISNPTRARKEMGISISRKIIMWGIFFLEEIKAAAKTIAKNIEIRNSKVSPVPPPPVNKLKVLLLLVEATIANIASETTSSCP